MSFGGALPVAAVAELAARYWLGAVGALLLLAAALDLIGAGAAIRSGLDVDLRSQPEGLATAAEILRRNLLVAAVPLVGAWAIPRVPAMRTTLDTCIAVAAALAIAFGALVLSAHGLDLIRYAVAFGPVELAGFATAAAVYVTAARHRPCSVRQLGPAGSIAVALLAIAAVLEARWGGVVQVVEASARTPPSERSENMRALVQSNDRHCNVLTTSFAIVAAIALLMPGFVIAELSVARSARSSRSDLELALRAVAYALVIHVVFAFWTVHLVSTVGPLEEWPDHWGSLSAYVAVVLLGVPVAVGMALNAYLARAELADGPPSRVAAGFGAGEARDAFDYAFQRRRATGAWVIVELVGHTSADPRLVGGIFGQRSAIGQTPAPHDVYLESLCTVSEDEQGVRRLAQRLDPERGVYIAAGQIARIELLAEETAAPPVQ